MNNFFKAGTHNGQITIQNPATGKHRTFRIKTQSKNANFAPGKRIVSLKISRDDNDDWRGWRSFGFVSDQGIRVWKSQANTVFATYAKMLDTPKSWRNKGARYLVEGTCRVCNRTLTNPLSIETGIGPICAGRS